MKSTLFFIVLVFHCVSAQFQDDLNWHEFKANHQKSYSDGAEELKR